MSDLIDSYFGSYQLKAVIRQGGMATIYKAYQASLDRYVAVKVMFDNHDPQFAPRFRREARAVAQLQHPNIVQIYEYGEERGLFFLAMQFVEHSTALADVLVKPMAPVDALRITARVLDALAYAHSRNVIHRDIKPGNILLTGENWPMLIDFGIAKLIGDNMNLTLPGTAIGTPAYMAPEQAEGRAVDARSDLYAMGVVLYEMVTGRVPFDADTPMAVLMKHVYEAPPPPQTINPAVPTALNAVLMRALEKNPAARYQSAAEMSADLLRLATQLEQVNSRATVDSLYAAAVQAFEEGRWGAAVDQLNQVVALDASYADATDLLEAAREAQERTRQDAKERLTLVRQRQLRASQGADSQPGLTAQAGPPTPVPAPLTTASSTNASGQAPAIPAAPATTRLDISDVPGLSSAAPNASSPPQPAVTGVAASEPALGGESAPPKKRAGALPWLIAGAVALVALALLVTRLAGLWGVPAVAVDPTSGAPTAAATSDPAAPTASSEQPTAQPTTAEPTAEAPTTAPAPEPVGDLMFEDDFNAGASRSGLEDQVRDPAFSRGFHDPGHYHFRIAGQNETRWVMLPRLAYSNYSMQLDVWDNSDAFTGSVAQGVIFRVQDNEHFYALLLDSRNARYTVRKLEGKDSWSDLIAWKESPLIKRAPEINNVRLDGTGDAFTIYLNDAALETFSDGTYSFGMLGLIVANEDATAPHMHFDNLKIWSDDAAAAPTLPLQREDETGAMVLVPQGPFIMGGNERADEWAHLLTLPDFYIDRNEVTNAEYAACVTAGKCTPQQAPSSQSHPNYATQDTYAGYPVIQVSWEQARDYCAWAGKRLPTEAEWEKAASWNRALNQKLAWPWEGDFDSERLNSAESNAGDTLAVGQYPAEINGTTDMGGNVSEWTSSLYLPYPYDAGDGREDSAAAGDRVFRGGSWAQTEGKAKAIYRQGAAASYFGREIGFRCAANP